MVEEIHEILIDYILLEKNLKITKDETLDSYLNSLKKDDLVRLAILHTWNDEKFDELIRIRLVANKPKKYIKDYIKEKLEIILTSYIKVIDVENLNGLKKILDKNGYLEYDEEDFDLSLNFIMFLKNFSLAKVHYSKREGKIRFFMPAEFVEVFKDALENNELISYNQKFNDSCNFINGVLQGYGMIELDKLYELFNKHMYSIDEEELLKILGAKSTISEEIFVNELPNGLFVCNMMLSEQDIAYMFNLEVEGDYYDFTKRDFELLNTEKYIHNLKSYKKLWAYLKEYYDVVESERKDIDGFCLLEYINTAQLSLEDANDSLKDNVLQFFEADGLELEKLCRMIKDIYNEYPKWKKRGNK